MANSKKGGGFMAFVEKHLMPIAVKLGQMKPLIAIRDGIAISMPLIIIGSLFMVINNFPIPVWTAWLAKTTIKGATVASIFAKIVNGSFGLIGLVSAFGIAASYAEQYKTDGKSAGVIALSAYFVVTPSIMSGDKVPVEGMPYNFLGSQGLFVAILLGLLAGWIFQWFINNDIQIKLPDTVPPAVAKSFSALIPGAVVITIFGALYAIFTWTGLGNIHLLLFHILSKPLGLLGDTLGGTIVAIMLNSLFWFIGIHGGNIINPIISPIWLMNTDANRVLFQAGHLDLAHHAHIITQPFMDNFVYMGGGGATIGLVMGIGILIFMKRSSKQLDVMGPLTITPGIFNINEPTMFGLPVVLNTTLIIPFIVAPCINAITTYFAMATGLVPLCNGTMASWTMPPIISGFLVTNSWTGSALQAVNIVLDILMYFPFLIAMNKQQKIEEAGKEVVA
ncbi:cellobiose-specific PTS IIC [Companilactobacillus paralimentarius DSM 13238 = JCM 10415]|jgi:PTS system, lactose/cellobiose family IIC component|uniref:Permease IIC component n=1 Tax=Companilactobacillus paralimentarius DSM 13238 = JCM 10415 TaxID=1122151 RepID=A0A0R1PFT2_9LACO|nr:PTS sugar transporter subunit IIC [Companilactobacillus paralimentarius]KAE9564367.1 PTS cellobiose transporter subunit IIC [Companilactobacillus paralimentarius]KRL31293.1 cellobiose-specific PTS IIC [Companilactobacillus paralimentarius DSM 13238 = JCM 10415]MDR4932958.1 PTS sugar transporter subunit IIC [Companilactobacillus paralimentarius]QFR69493.1 PTS cellobiose transporter subunit IIC [Companilactobacillus paralimentarius]